MYQAKYFRVVQKQIERNGRTFTKDFIERNAAALILPLSKNGEIYLLQQYRDSFQKEILEICAGTIESGDDPIETAKRELKEETGLTAGRLEKIATWEVSANMRSTNYIFAAFDVQEGTASPNADEAISVVKMPFSEAVAKALSGEILVASHVAGILLLNTLLKEGKVQL